MEQHFRELVETFNSGDPEIRSWFLIRHNYLPFILCGSYALFSTIIGPAIMKNRKPFELRIPMIIFNFSVVATYVTALTIIALYLPRVSWERFCKGGGTVKQGDLTYLLTRSCWVIYMLKYVEFLDTVFFVLRKKDNLITFLHVMHHSVVPILGWIMFRTEKSGFQTIPVLLNAAVHVIMYSYYGLAAIGPQVRKYLWWKKYLTQLQMVQFILMIIFVVIIAPLSGCTMVHFSYLMDLSFAPLFLYLFYRFYKSAFVPRQKAEEVDKHTTNGFDKNHIETNGSAKKNGVTNGAAKREILTNGSSKREILTNGSGKREILTNGSAKQDIAANGSAKKHAETNGISKKDE